MTDATVQGWNKKYDEWVEEVGCASENPESLIVPNKTKPKGGASHAGASKFDLAKPQVRSLDHAPASSDSLGTAAASCPASQHQDMCRYR